MIGQGVNMRMNSNYIKLIRILLDKDGWTTSKVLSAQLDISLRSIKYYIAEINSVENELIISSRKGYKINNKQAEILLKNLDVSLPQTSQERVNYIINQVFHSRQRDGSKIDLYEIADQIYISYETIQKDMAKIREKLQRYHLALVSSDSTVTILGDRINKRKLLYNTFSKEAKNNFLSLKVIENKIPGYNLRDLQSIIQEQCDQYHYYINSYTLSYFMLDVVISAFYVKNMETCRKHRRVKHYGIIEPKLVEFIANEIERHFDITYHAAEEMEELNIILSSYLIRKDYSEISINDIESIVGTECMHIVTEIIDLMKDIFLIHLEGRDFIVKFALFIKSLLIRIDNGYSIKNPLVNNIKRMAPLVFIFSTVVAERLEEMINKEINDDEIAYIAFHIGEKIEKQKAKEEVIDGLLFLPQYYDYSSRLYDKLKKRYENQIDMKLVTLPIDEIECPWYAKQADIVISTMPVPENVFIDWVNITPFLNRRDFDTMNKTINKIKLKKAKSKLRKYLLQMSHPRFYFKNVCFQSKEDAIQSMADIMKEEDYVDSSFFDGLFAKENPSSFILDFIIVPNTIKMNTNKIGLSILINEKDSIDWNGHNIYCILLFSLNREGRNIYQYVFNHLVAIMYDKLNKVKLMECSSYDEFIDTAIDCLQ